MQGLFDSFDRLILSPNQLTQTYSMGVIITQKHISTNMLDTGHSYMHHILKQKSLILSISGGKNLPLRRSS